MKKYSNRVRYNVKASDCKGCTCFTVSVISDTSKTKRFPEYESAKRYFRDIVGEYLSSACRPHRPGWSEGSITVQLRAEIPDSTFGKRYPLIKMLDLCWTGCDAPC